MLYEQIEIWYSIKYLIIPNDTQRASNKKTKEWLVDGFVYESSKVMVLRSPFSLLDIRDDWFYVWPCRDSFSRH